MKLFLVRHGKDEEGYLGGWSQRGLTEEGYIQAERLATYLHEKKEQNDIKHLYSSDLQRAAETAEAISEKLQLPIQWCPAFREMNNGDLAGLPIEEAAKRYPGMYFSTLKMDERYPNGESPQEYYDRIKESFMEFLSAVEENTLLVTHGGVINIIYCIVKGLEWNNRSVVCKAEHGSLFLLETDTMEFEIENFRYPM